MEGPTSVRVRNIQGFLEGTNFQALSDYSPNREMATPMTELPKQVLDIYDVLEKLNMELKYVKSGSTGHTFCAVSKSDPKMRMAVKVSAYPKKRFGHMDDLARPENVELVVLSFLSRFVTSRRTPHLVLPITAFRTHIDRFIGFSDLQKHSSIYNSFVRRYHKGKFEPYVSVLFSEWCEGGDLLDYVRENYKVMTQSVWEVIFMQLLLTLTAIHKKYPGFRHNDLKANNVLVQYTQNRTKLKTYRYTLDNHEFLVPDIALEIKIWDFDFACIDGIISNSKLQETWTDEHNITCKQNRYYDMHFFFSSLAWGKWFRGFNRKYIPEPIIEFVERIIPEELRPVYRMQTVTKKRKNRKTGIYERYQEEELMQLNTRLGPGGRVANNREYTTPQRILLTDPLFAKYRQIAVRD